MTEPVLSHLDGSGAAHMVDVSGKAETTRRAIAEGHISLSETVKSAIRDGNAPKGDVIAAARIAGIMAAKRTGELIPLCHPLPISSVALDFAFDDEGLCATADVGIHARTGVEMEALTAVSVALLTIYDMVKAVDKGCVISGIRLTHKEGGKSGTWTATI